MAAKGKHMAKDPNGALKVAGIVAASLIALLVVAYLAGAAVFSHFFFPNSSVGRADVSLMTKEAAAAELQQALDSRSVVVTGQGVSFSVLSTQAGMSSNVDRAVSSVLGEQNPWAWPLEISQSHDADNAVRSSCDSSVLKSYIEEAIAEHNATAAPATDASLYYDSNIGMYRIDPGDAGEVLDVDRVTARVISAFGEDSSYAYLTSDELVGQSVTAESPRLNATLDAANVYLGCNFGLTVNGAQIATLDSNTVASWVSFAENGQVVFDYQQLVAWCDAVEKLVDDVGATRSYTRADGKYVTVSGGSYGWLSDGAALESTVAQAILDKAQGQIEIPFKQTAQSLDHGGREWGTRYVDVDLAEQFVRFYGDDGSIIWSSDCISGAAGSRDTPAGVWFVNNKALNQVLVGLDENHDGEPDYRTPVTYWMPFEGNSVGFHDADWQPGFGGSLYSQGYGSHGCINLPPSKAAELYGIIQIGDVVVVHY